MTEPKRIYVAGPYSDETRQGRYRNTVKAMNVGLALMDMGHYPFIPHLTHFLDEHATLEYAEVDYEEWIDYDEEWLRQCDWFYIIGPSPGVNQELEIARELDMEVFETIGQVPNVTDK